MRASERYGRQLSSRMAYAEDVTALHKAQPMIAQLWRALEQHTELTYEYDFLLQPRQRCALPEVRG